MTKLADEEWNHPDINHKEYDDIGIVKDLGDHVCEYTFKNDIVELSLEIADPMVLEITKDVKVTIPDMVGTVGNNNNTFANNAS